MIEDSWNPTGLEEFRLSQVTAALKIKQSERPQNVRLWWESGKPNPPAPFPLGEGGARVGEAIHPSPLRGGAGGGVPPKPKVALPSDVGVDYTELERLLAAGKWQEADSETGRLMLQAARQENRGYLNEEDIKKFSCSDLRTLDQLWVKYSSGRFGFSVQKRIWESVGGKPGEYNESVYIKFCDRNGWRVNGKWISYYDLTFSPLAPQGHLPCACVREWSKDGGGGVCWGFDSLLSSSSLASRLVDCST